ncbi:MAG TPA: M48 family metallopeptidase [Vicinamibacterales bacterium]|nr:M48 family metallopeptidase [Vicinamibacterales bacterium]
MQPGLPFEPEYPPHLFVRHPRARRYVVSVREDGRVRVTLPRWGSMREAQEFAGRLDEWIERQRRRLEANRRQTRVFPEQDRQEVLARAKRELPARLLELAAHVGVSVAKVSVRNQRWRWGSCSPRGHICLNWRLVIMPDWVRDYVLIHELMHLRRLDHSRKFWKLVAEWCPDYQAARRWLHENGRSL